MNRFVLHPYLLGFVVGLGLVAGLPSPASEPEESSPLSEAQQNRIQAAAEFATAETQFELGELDLALRGYQRARYWDPALEGPLEKIVPLAFSLGRADEAIRYALISKDLTDPALLRRLALYETEQGAWRSALELHRRWLAQTPVSLDTASGERLARLMVQLEVARLEYLTDQVAAASESFETVQQVLLAGGDDSKGKLLDAIGGGTPEFWEAVGRCHWEAKRLQPARQAFGQMATSPEAQPRAEYWLAELDAEAHPYEAYERLKAYFDAGEDPLGTAPYDLLRRLMGRLNDQPGLTTDLTRLAESGRPYAVDALAAVVTTQGDRNRAEKLYRSQLEGVNGHPVDEVLAVRATNWLIDQLAHDGRLGDFSLLVPQVSAALTDFDSIAPALGKALEDSPQAELLAKRLAGWSLEGRSVEELACAAWLARMAGQEGTATKMHREAVERDPEFGPQRCLVWAVELLYADRPKLAAEALQWGLERDLWDVNDGEPYFYLATALALSKQHEAALTAAREAARRQEDSADMAARVAWVLFNAERQQEAVVEYEQLIERFNDDPDPTTREALQDARMTLSYIVLEEGQADAAAEWLLQVLDEFPGDPGAQNDLAYLWVERGLHLAKATEMAEAAVAAEPKNAAYLDTLGWAQFRSGEPSVALATINKALHTLQQAGEELDAEILDHRGDVLAALGRPAEAHKSWQEAATRLSEANPQLAERVRRKLKESAEQE